MKRLLFIFISMVLISQVINAQENSYSDWYENFVKAFQNPFFREPNAGTAALPVLMIPGTGRIEAMGSAYTAAAFDGGVLASNPASTSIIDFTELTFSHSNWIADSSLEQIYYTSRFDNFGMGARAQLIYATFTENDDFSKAVNFGNIAEMLLSLNASYNFLNSYSFNGIAVGGSLKFAYRHIPEVFAADQSALAFMIDLGVRSSFDVKFLKFYYDNEDNLAVGAALKNIGPNVGPDPLPAEFSIGVSYLPIRPLTIDLDFNLPFNFSAEINASKPNFNLGFNLQFANFFSLQGGFRYSGQNPRFSIGACVELPEMTINSNFVLDYTTLSADGLNLFDRVSIQMAVNLGDRGRKDKQDRVDKYVIDGVNAFGAENYDKAIEYFKRALELDPSHDYAARYLAQSIERLDTIKAFREAGLELFQREETQSANNEETTQQEETEQ